MCRLAAYFGPRITLKQFLLDPPHSLDTLPVTYPQAQPIWIDGNAQALQSDLWFSLRSATPGSPINPANAQPSGDDELLFAHNDFVMARPLRQSARYSVYEP